jgi:hypothetical protein
MRRQSFTASANQALGHKSGLPIPAFLLRLMLWEMAEASRGFGGWVQ